jgi:hypothetical protein
VSEGFGRHAAPRLLLEPVVADGGRGREPGFDVARVEQDPPSGCSPRNQLIAKTAISPAPPSP